MVIALWRICHIFKLPEDGCRNQMVIRFLAISPQSFYHLVSPKYQIELQRRLKAIAHLEIAEVAALAARAEGHKVDDLKSLASFGFLPEGFDKRPDGARVLNLDGEWIDSLRSSRVVSAYRGR